MEKQEPVAWYYTLRCACNYIDKLGGVSQQYRAMLAAAPEAKPCP